MYASDPDVYFFLCNAVDLVNDLSVVWRLARGLAKMHTNGVNPHGR